MELLALPLVTFAASAVWALTSNPKK